MMIIGQLMRQLSTKRQSYASRLAKYPSSDSRRRRRRRRGNFML
jgi:hypothetical protein